MMRKTCICRVFLYMLLVFTFMTLRVINEKSFLFRPMEHIGYSGHVMKRKLAEFEHGKDFQERSVYLEHLKYSACGLNSSMEYQCPTYCVEENKQSVEQPNGNSQQLCDLEKLVSDCRVLRHLHGYNDAPVTREEMRFPLAFAMYVSKSAAATEQIFRTIYRAHNVYCFHVDFNADARVVQTIQKLTQCFENVKVIRDREKMVPASFNLVKAELKCMRVLVDIGRPWKYYINLSEKEFPLRTNLEMVRILSLFNGLNDIETYDHPVFHSWRHEQKYELSGNSIVRVGNKDKFKYRLKLGMGNPRGLFARKFVNFVLHDEIAQDILSWFNDTFSPAESVWATLVTLPWAPGGYPITIRHMINTYVSRAYIQAEDQQKCHGRYASALCHLSCGDLKWIKSRPQFFANDFDYERDKSALNCLEHWYRDKTMVLDDVAIDWMYYSNLPHLKYHRNAKRLKGSLQNLSDFSKVWLAKHLIA